MKLSNLIPPSDLLEKIEGLEAGLRQRHRLSRFGWLGGALAALASLIEILSQLQKAGWPEQFPELELGWWLLVPAAGFVLLFMAAWSKYWLKESSPPIRYSCSLGHFSAVSSEEHKPATGGERGRCF